MSAEVGNLVARLKVELDDSEALQEFRAAIRALDNEPDPRISVNLAEADAKIARMQTVLAQIAGQDVEIQVDADTNPAIAEMAKAQEAAKALERFEPKVRIAAETIGAERDLSRLDGILDSVTSAQHRATVVAETGQALTELELLRAQLNGLDNRPVHVQARADVDAAIEDLRQLRFEMGLVEQDSVEVAVKTSTSLAGVSSSLATVGKSALAIGGGLGIAQMGLSLLGRAAGFLGDALVGVPLMIEDTRARLMAFTKDAGQTEEILRQVNEEAAKTPFEFAEMAQATASLLPVSKRLNENWLDLLRTAEILAAVNPAEGLAGAAFALREAASGDFTSIIERFDLPRQYINQLKEEGVPSIEIVRRAMVSLGYDTSLVANLAETTRGKWSTLMDNLRTAGAKLGEPFVELVNGALTDLINYTETDAFGAMVEDWGKKAETAAGKVRDIGRAIAEIPDNKDIKFLFHLTIGTDGETGEEKRDKILEWANDVAEGLNWTFGQMNEAGRNYREGAIDFFTNDMNAISDAMHGNFSSLDELFKNSVHESRVWQEHVEESLNAVSGTSRDEFESMRRDQELQSASANAFVTTLDRLRNAGMEENATQQERAASLERMDQLYGDGDAYLRSYYSGLADGAGQALLAADAQHKLNTAIGDLAGVQGNLNDVMGAFSAQGAEYSGTANALTKAHDVLQKKQADGIQLSESEQQLLDAYPDLYARITGAQDDAAVQEGLVAGAKIKVMEAQDELNAAISRGETDLGPYNQRLDDARKLLADVDPQSGMQVAMENLGKAIGTDLVSAINDLIAKLNEIDGRSVTLTIESRFITTGDPTNAQMFGYQSGSGYVGITAGGNAAGGVIDRPMLSMVGEEAPAHPEYIIPTNPGRRSRALSLWMDAGHSLGVPGFADGGGPAPSSGGAGGGGVAPGAIDWSFIFAGLDTEAEDYTERAAQAFVRFFGDIEALANGDALKSAQEKLNDLFTIRQIAIDSGAGEAVVAGIDAQIADQQAQVNAIGQVMGSEVVAGMAAAMASAEAQQQVNESLKKTLMDLSSASDPYQKVQGLGQEVADLKEAIAVAEAMGNMDVAAELRAELEAAQNEFLQAQNALTKMLKLGLLDDATIKEMAERGGEGFRQVYDTVFGEGALAALQDGWSRLSAEQFTQLQAFVGKGKDLSDQMVASILDGLTSGALSIEQAMQLLGGEQGKLAVSQQKQLAAQLEQTEQQLMQALASGDQTRIATAQENYDALMELIQAYAAATGRTVDDIVGSWRRVDTTLRNAVSGQAIRVPNAGPPSMSSNGAFPAQSGFQTYATPAQTINLQLLEGKTIASWMMYDVAREVALTPSALGGIG